MPERSYEYESQQASLLKPYYQRWLWDHVLAALPTSLSPNAMTVIGTLCCAGSFLIATLLNQSPLALLAAAFLVVAYLSLDNLDGAQARRLGRSTRLGEFLDHWLDTFNNGFIVVGACAAAGLEPVLTLLVLGCGTLAFYAVQWELRNTGVFRMGRIADIEGNTAVALLYIALAIFGRDAFQLRPLPGLPTAATFLGCGVIAQALWTTFSAARRNPDRLSDFFPLATAFGALVLWAMADEPNNIRYLVIGLLLNPVFTSGPIRERLQLSTASPALDWLVVAFVAGAALLSSATGLDALDGGVASAAVVVLLGALTLRHFATSVAKLTSQPSEQPIAKPVPTARLR